ncbi:MAG: hypothetical protein JNJ60_23515 [Rhodocyclaceae bacterium]|nr:hypothetical protein [Rhodocyclaceae bacterium]
MTTLNSATIGTADADPAKPAAATAMAAAKREIFMRNPFIGKNNFAVPTRGCRYSDCRALRGGESLASNVHAM